MGDVGGLFNALNFIGFIVYSYFRGPLYYQALVENLFFVRYQSKNSGNPKTTIKNIQDNSLKDSDDGKSYLNSLISLTSKIKFNFLDIFAFGTSKSCIFMHKNHNLKSDKSKKES